MGSRLHISDDKICKFIINDVSDCASDSHSENYYRYVDEDIDLGQLTFWNFLIKTSLLMKASVVLITIMLFWMIIVQTVWLFQGLISSLFTSTNYWQNQPTF